MVKKDTLKRLAPRLRFAECADGPGWEERPFGDLYAFKPTSTLSRDKLNYENGTIRSIHYGDIHMRFPALLDIGREVVPFVTHGSADDFDVEAFCAEGDIVFADASEDLDDVGKCTEVVDLHGERVVCGTHTILATRRGAHLVVGFGGFLFRSERMRQQIKRESQGSKVYGISSGRLENVKVCFPVQVDEQRKIAECLSSLEDRIAAEERKLDALRAHKNGLMQQIFPSEGELRPRLRFPGYCKDWSRVPVGKVAAEYRATSTVQDEHEVLTSARRGLVRQADYYGEGRITARANVGFNVIPPDFITYRSRSDDGRFFFNRNELGISGLVSVYYPVFRSVKGSNAFLTAILNQLSADLGRQAVGTSQRVLPLSTLFRFEIPVPHQDEQHRIAALLSSVDAVIDAQSRQLDGLRAHRSGLMQELFPSPEAS